MKRSRDESFPEANPHMKRKVVLLVAYNGLGFSGLQKQPDGIETIESTLEAAIIAARLSCMVANTCGMRALPRISRSIHWSVESLRSSCVAPSAQSTTNAVDGAMRSTVRPLVSAACGVPFIV